MVPPDQLYTSKEGISHKSLASVGRAVRGKEQGGGPRLLLPTGTHSAVMYFSESTR